MRLRDENRIIDEEVKDRVALRYVLNALLRRREARARRLRGASEEHLVLRGRRRDPDGDLAEGVFSLAEAHFNSVIDDEDDKVDTYRQATDAVAKRLAPVLRELPDGILDEAVYHHIAEVIVEGFGEYGIALDVVIIQRELQRDRWLQSESITGYGPMNRSFIRRLKGAVTAAQEIAGVLGPLGCHARSVFKVASAFSSDMHDKHEYVVSLELTDDLKEDIVVLVEEYLDL